MPVVELNVKAVEILFATCGDVGHKSLGCFASFFRSNHDGRSVSIVGTNKVNLVTLHALETHPDIGLDVLHDVPDVERAVGVGQGSGDE